MDEQEFLADQFEAHRSHLRAVAYRMLGSVSEADDAVQEAWLRLQRSDADAIENLGGWLTTVVARVSLNVLRSRASHPEDPLDEVRVPEPLIDRADGVNPEHEALLADSVGLALLVVLETLQPAERLAFVLHDMFGVPFDEIAPMVDRSPDAARQLASRARRRVRGEAPPPTPDMSRQRAVVDAYLAASREGDFERLVSLLDPDVILRSDGGTLRPHATVVVRGAREVATRAVAGARLAGEVHVALVNGAAGMVATRDDRVFAVLGFTVVDDRIVAIDALSDPDRLAELDVTFLS